MKYKFKYVPDDDGWVSTYLKAISKINADNEYVLTIDHDLDAPMETWTLQKFYTSVNNGIFKRDCCKGIVYDGKQLTDDQRDMMVDLVLETEYLTFEL